MDSLLEVPAKGEILVTVKTREILEKIEMHLKF